jgi:hypothetical protein
MCATYGPHILSDLLYRIVLTAYPQLTLAQQRVPRSRQRALELCKARHHALCQVGAPSSSRSPAATECSMHLQASAIIGPGSIACIHDMDLGCTLRCACCHARRLAAAQLLSLPALAHAVNTSGRLQCSSILQVFVTTCPGCALHTCHQVILD